MRIVKTLVGIAILMALAAVMVLPAQAESYIDEEYVEICKEVSRAAGVSPYILIALIERESSGNPEAVNGACTGLCQLNKYQFEGDLFDPYTNISQAAIYLSELGEKYDFDTAVCLMAYHGESNCNQKKVSKYARGIIERAWDLENIY